MVGVNGYPPHKWVNKVNRSVCDENTGTHMACSTLAEHELMRHMVKGAMFPVIAGRIAGDGKETIHD